MGKSRYQRERWENRFFSFTNVNVLLSVPKSGMGSPTHAKLGVGTCKPLITAGSTYFIDNVVGKIARTTRMASGVGEANIFCWCEVGSASQLVWHQNEFKMSPNTLKRLDSDFEGQIGPTASGKKRGLNCFRVTRTGADLSERNGFLV